MPRRLLRRLPRPSGADHAGRRQQTRRGLVLRRGADRAEEHAHPALGRTRDATLGPKDQRTQSAYIFGAICPARGVGAGLVMPHCTTEAMAHHLEEIAATVNGGPHRAPARSGRLAHHQEAART